MASRCLGCCSFRISWQIPWFHKFNFYDVITLELYDPGLKTSFTHIEHCAPAVGQEGLANQIPVLTLKYLLPSQWVLVLSPHIPNKCSHYTKVWHRTYLIMYHSTFEIVTLQLCSVTEIRPKSPFLCVNRSATRYDFCAKLCKSHLV